jgi:hypothetical protein
MRDWWLRTLLVLQQPRPVFVALRDDSKQSLSDRSEPILAIVVLAGIAAVLTTSTAGHLLDDSNYDDLLVAVWAFIAGSLYGVFGYFAFGALLHAGAKAFGSQGTYRRSRQVLAFASVPVALSLILVPVKIALYGNDLFRRGGSDTGTGAHVFAGLQIAFLVWAGALLVIGVRSVHGWTWQRAAAASLLALTAPVVLGLST